MKKIRIIIILFFFNCISLALSIFALKANSETKIVAKSGDTLLKISKQYGVHLKELMYKNNFNDANKILDGKVIILPLIDNDKVSEFENLTYKVVEGDTLYRIARDHGVKLKEIIAINNLKSNSLLELDQIIILPQGSIHKKEISSKKVNLEVKKVFYHKTSTIEDLSIIAETHKIPIEEIKILNNLSNPIKINPNIKLKLRENKPLRWLKYGSIMINWSDWTYIDGNYVTKAKTKTNKSFYLGISCQKRALNNTLNDSKWRIWYFPENDFEFKLINDFCDQD